MRNKKAIRSTETVKLGAVISINPDSVEKDFRFETIKYIDISSVGSGTLNGLSEIKFSEAPSRAKRLVNSADTILSTVRPNRRSFLFVKNPEPNIVVSTGFAVLRATNKVDSRYLYYTVTHQPFTDYLTNNAKGAAYPAVDTDTIARAEIWLPPLPTQRKIAAILSTYDDLIENNLRRVKILEGMAQLVYREWFVNFRFPGHEDVRMVESELGMIPEGWETKKTKEIIRRLKAGNTYTMNDVQEIGEVIVVDQSRDEYLGFHNNEADHKASLDKPIIIFGDHTCKMQLMVEAFSVGPNVVPFVAVNNLSIYYVFLLVKDLVLTREYKRHWTELSNRQVAVSLLGITKQFANLVIPMFEDIETLRKKNINLRRTRDLLLPKLISGEMDVSELDIDIGEGPV